MTPSPLHSAITKANNAAPHHPAILNSAEKSACLDLLHAAVNYVRKDEARGGKTCPKTYTHKGKRFFLRMTWTGQLFVSIAKDGRALVASAPRAV